MSDTCENCGIVLPKKPVKIIVMFGMSDRYSLLTRMKSGATVQLFCSLKCRDDFNGNWVDCINPPKDALNVEDGYPDEPNGQFYCPNCNKHTSQKTYLTTCIKCNTSLIRTNPKVKE